jgi:hypothetical protein
LTAVKSGAWSWQSTRAAQTWNASHTRISIHYGECTAKVKEVTLVNNNSEQPAFFKQRVATRRFPDISAISGTKIRAPDYS